MKRTAQIFIYSIMGAAISYGGCTSASNSPGVGYHGNAGPNELGVKARVESPVLLAAPAPRPKVRLSGITTILGKRMAFLVISGSEPGGKPKYLSLGEGQREQEIEVQEIDAKRGIVKILNGGQEQILDFTAPKT